MTASRWLCSRVPLGCLAEFRLMATRRVSGQHISHRSLNGTWPAIVGTSQAGWILLLTFVELIAGEVTSMLAVESRILHTPIP
jgi:hypothetical protein